MATISASGIKRLGLLKNFAKGFKRQRKSARARASPSRKRIFNSTNKPSKC
jgi:hypothetical protein